MQQFKIKLWKFTANVFSEITFWGFVCIGNSENLKYKGSTASLCVNFPFSTNKHERKKHREKIMS